VVSFVILIPLRKSYLFVIRLSNRLGSSTYAN
jgi:hypothetical protein